VDAERRLLALATRQHGCASIDQALACGLTADQVHYRFRLGRWTRIGVHVFRIEGAPVTWDQQLTAGLLDLGPCARVSHRAAAALYDFDGFARSPVEFVVPRSGGGAETVWKVHTTLTMAPIDGAEVAGFRCTSAARTIIDLARVASAIELERAIDSATRDGWVSPVFLRRQLERLRGSGRAGVSLLDELLPDSGGHSDLERRFLALIRRAGLPRPTCQAIIRRGGTTLARADFRFDPYRVLAEVSGRRGHVSDAERAKDARRRNELQHEGYVVLEFTNAQVRKEQSYVGATVRRELILAGWPLAADPAALRTARSAMNGLGG
jgi:hypothetical protein